VKLMEKFLNEMTQFANAQNVESYFATELKVCICLQLIQEIVEENYNSATNLSGTTEMSRQDASLFAVVLKVTDHLDKFRKQCIMESNNAFAALEARGVHAEMSIQILECLQSVHSICGMHELRRYEHLDEFQLFGKHNDMRSNSPTRQTNILQLLMEEMGHKPNEGQEWNVLIRFLMDHLMFNLQSWGNNESILYRTLQCLEKLVMNTSMCKQGSDCFTFLKEIVAKCSTQMPFLQEPKMVKMRTSYFAVLAASLFLLHEGSLNEVFEQLISPIEQNIKEILSGQGTVKEQTLKCVYVFRDLRGISMAARSQPAYDLLGDWLLNQKQFLELVCRESTSNMNIMQPVLKFFREMTLNRKQRLKYSRTSPFPYRLFRICTKFIDNIVTEDESKNEGFETEEEYTQSITLEEIYSTKYKILKECCWILGHFFQSKHVNFACLRLYNEPLVEVIPQIVHQLVSLPFEHVMTFTDLQHAVQFFFCGLFASCPFILCEIEVDVLAKIFNMMFAFLHACTKQRSCVVGGMIIQEHNVITRPLMYAMESVGKYWEKNGFRPREVLKKAWIELLRCGCSQISRWTLCTPAMFYFLTLLERSDRADVLLEIPHVLQERNYTEQRIKDVLQDLEKIFQNVPFPGDKRSILARNRTQQLFCQNIVKSFRVR